MDFLDKHLSNYVDKHTQNEPDLLYALNRETHLKVLNPRMLAGHLQGRVLSMLSHMIQPSKVLEVGTYTGYSAICFSEGLKEGGEIHTIDINEELEPIQTKYFEKAGIANNVKRYVGNALAIIPQIEGPFDIVFLDADKENYLKYFELTLPKIKKDGYLLADNVLWSGKILEENPKADDVDTIGLKAFNDAIQKDIRVENVLFPIRDGLMVCRKL